MNKELYIMLDTETANEIDCALCYDISFAVIDRTGKFYATYSFVVADIFCDEKYLMENCYFSEKIPSYEEAIRNGTKTLKTLKNIRKTFRRVCRDFNIKAVVAHNAFFDYSALNNTMRYVTKSKYRYFLPYKMPIYDTLKMARQIFATNQDYVNFCKENHLMRYENYPRLTAEAIYRFLTKNPNFEEEHIGIEDVKIEAVIFAECMKNDEIEKNLFPLLTNP